MTGQLELSLKDIKFLRAIRDVNASPERFAGTEGGTSPATVTAITKATTLTKDEVNYRLNHRGLADEDLITVHKAELKENGSFGPKSADITDAGETELRRAQKQQGLVESDGDGLEHDDAADDRVARLEARIAELEDRTGASADADVAALADRLDEVAEEVAALRSTTERLESTAADVESELEAIRESPDGALGEKRQEQLDAAIRSMVAFHQLADRVLDVRVEKFEPSSGRPDGRLVKGTRRNVLQALEAARPGGDSRTGGGSAGNWPDQTGSGARVYTGEDAEEADGAEQNGEPDLQTEAAVDATDESEAPETGIYPPIGSDADDEESPRSTADADDATEDNPASEGGIYPPIGSHDDDVGEAGADDGGADADDGQAEADDDGVEDGVGDSESVTDSPDSSADDVASDSDGGATAAVVDEDGEDADADGSPEVSGEEAGDTDDVVAESAEDGRPAYARVIDAEPPVEIVDARAKRAERVPVDEDRLAEPADLAPNSSEADAEDVESDDVETDDAENDPDEPETDAEPVAAATTDD